MKKKKMNKRILHNSSFLINYSPSELKEYSDSLFKSNLLKTEEDLAYDNEGNIIIVPLDHNEDNSYLQEAHNIRNTQLC